MFRSSLNLCCWHMSGFFVSDRVVRGRQESKSDTVSYYYFMTHCYRTATLSAKAHEHELIKHEDSFYNASVRSIAIPSLNNRLYRVSLVIFLIYTIEP